MPTNVFPANKTKTDFYLPMVTVSANRGISKKIPMKASVRFVITTSNTA